MSWGQFFSLGNWGYEKNCDTNRCHQFWVENTDKWGNALPRSLRARLTLPERSRLDHRVDGERQCVRKGNEPSRKEKWEAACCDQEWAFVWEAYSLLWW